MGLFGFGKDDARTADAQADANARAAGQIARGEQPSALQRAAGAQDDSGLNGMVNKLIARLMELGIEGVGPFDSAAKIADDATQGKSPRQAVTAIERSHRALAATGGFLTGLGGFVTMPVSLPANIVEFYAVATRMVASIAKVRGYDINDPHVRTAILLTLTGADSDDILKKAGLAAGGGRLTSLATSHLPAPALMVLNKAIGFRLISRAGEQTLARFGRAVPLVGGGIGAALDTYLVGKIAEQADKEFPPAVPGKTV